MSAGRRPSSSSASATSSSATTASACRVVERAPGGRDGGDARPAGGRCPRRRGHARGSTSCRWLTDARAAVLVDAAFVGGAPGTISVRRDDVAAGGAAAGGARRPAGLADLLAAAQLADVLPAADLDRGDPAGGDRGPRGAQRRRRGRAAHGRRDGDSRSFAGSTPSRAPAARPKRTPRHGDGRSERHEAGARSRDHASLSSPTSWSWRGSSSPCSSAASTPSPRATPSSRRPSPSASTEALMPMGLAHIPTSSSCLLCHETGGEAGVKPDTGHGPPARGLAPVRRLPHGRAPRPDRAGPPGDPGGASASTATRSHRTGRPSPSRTPTLQDQNCLDCHGDVRPPPRRAGRPQPDECWLCHKPHGLPPPQKPPATRQRLTCRNCHQSARWAAAVGPRPARRHDLRALPRDRCGRRHRPPHPPPRRSRRRPRRADRRAAGRRPSGPLARWDARRPVTGCR